MIVLEDVASLVRDYVVYERHGRHDQSPIETDAAARIATAPPLRLIYNMDGWARYSKEFPHRL